MSFNYKFKNHAIVEVNGIECSWNNTLKGIESLKADLEYYCFFSEQYEIWNCFISGDGVVDKLKFSESWTNDQVTCAITVG